MPARTAPFVFGIVVVLGFHGSVWGAPGFNQQSLSDSALPTVPKGFRVTEFAKEPVLHNPAAIAFGPKGRLFVAQGPQFRHPDPGTPGDEIVILEDRDGDGVAEVHRKYAYGFNCIQSLAWKGQDLWVANAPDLTVVRDLDGDDVADEYLLVYSGVGTLEHALHGLNWAPDGRLYLSKGDTPVLPEAPEAFRDLAHVSSDFPAAQPIRTFNAPDAKENPYRGTYIKPTDPHTEGGILRCEGMGENLEVFAKGLRNPYDIAFDTEFNWLGTDNDQEGGDKILMPFYGASYGHRHPWTYQWTGENHPPTVPASGPFFHGSGTGVVYTDNPRFPETYRGVFFIGDWLQMKVYTFRPVWEGALMKSDSEELEVFAESGEEKSLFRPTDLAIGPEGAVYVSGWGKEYGAVWDPEGRQTNAGRIYKIEPEQEAVGSLARSEKREKPYDEWTDEELRQDLRSDLLVWRVNAQEELVRRSGKMKPVLQEALSSEDLPKGERTWLAWALGRMSTEDSSIDSFFLSLLKDTQRPLDLRVQSLRVLSYRAQHAGPDHSLPRDILSLLQEDHPRLRFEAVQAIWQASQAQYTPELVKALQTEQDRITYYSLWQSLQDLLPLEERKSLLFTSSEPRVRFGMLLGMLENEELTGEEVVQILESDSDPEIQHWASTWMANVGHGLKDPSQVIAKLLDLNKRGINYELRMNLLRTLERMEVKGENWVKLYEGFYFDHQDGEIYVPEKSQEIALCLKVLSRDDRALPILWEALAHDWEPVREAAIGGFRNLGDKGRGYLLDKLGAIEDQQMSGAIVALSQFSFTEDPWEGDEKQVETITDACNRSTNPMFRQKALTLLVMADEQTWRNPRAKRYAASLANQAVSDPDPRIYQLAEELGRRIGEKIQATKREPASIEGVLKHLDHANPENGKILFYQPGGRAACFRCHRVKDQGESFAPDLSDVGARLEPRVLVQSILDPNATITEGYRAQLIETEDGDLLTGVPVGETDSMLRLVQSDGEAIPIDKRDIVDRRNLETSIMPGNMSDLLTNDEVADIAAWLLRQRSGTGAH